ncbi:hypothetical protein CH363_19190 [Leptospira haakeii]|uniref:Uncharacterized protein n=1 Tax=Leptospira haakeii TaxID=2023198 RepID=A0ABX4PG20_9LEPT|nr:hypothetical protein CH363_19190 [Leptospira haakeii]PKA18184.1 hypothetical protein CH377_18945 [Leptospira haakeii]
MSNLSVLGRLLSKLHDFDKDHDSVDSLLKFFNLSIGALEAIPRLEIDKLSDLSDEIRIQSYYFLEECESDIDVKIQEAISCINRLIAIYK